MATWSLWAGDGPKVFLGLRGVLRVSVGNVVVIRVPLKRSIRATIRDL